MANPARALVLAVNAGSSSMKAALIENGEYHIASFLAERLGTATASIEGSLWQNQNSSSNTSSNAAAAWREQIPNCNHEQALQVILNFLEQKELLSLLVATGHRVVHGGRQFQDATVINETILQAIESVSHLAPLHNPHNIQGIRSIAKVLPHLPIVAVFDTAFHATLPPKAHFYPLPLEYRELGIRKYGFHGTSVRYVTEKANAILRQISSSSSSSSSTTTEAKDLQSFNLVVCHLGNGASVTAVDHLGQSVETSMGFSPLAGLMMGTRSGSIDPAIVSFAVHALNKTVDQVLNDLNKESGLKAVTLDHDYDMRSVLKRAQEGHSDAQLAVDMFLYRLVQHIASCLVALPGPVQALVFTAGIGEHSAEIRKRCIQQLKTTILPTLELDDERNNNHGKDSNGVLTKPSTWPVCLNIATDEEIMIAKDCLRLVSKH